MTDIYPFIKWVGGKTQLMESVFNEFPKIMLNYYEPFIGGGSVLFNLLNKLENREIIVNNIYISDINNDLIDLYLSVKNHYKQLIKYLQKFKNNYEKAEVVNKEKVVRKKIVVKKTLKANIKEGREHVYYFYRSIFNKLKMNKSNKIVKKSALFIFLNKTCFRGVYRENTSGIFNVPYGNNINVSMFDENNLKRISELLNKYDVNFSVKNFYDLKQTIKYTNNTFVYLDPPYYPENETSFTSYTSNDFGKDQHDRLIEFCKYIDLKKSKFLLSNSNTHFIKDNLKQYKTEIVDCKRQIHSKNPGAAAKEVLIHN